MTGFFDINGNTLSEKVMNAKKENLNYFVRHTNSTEDHWYFFEDDNDAYEYSEKYDEEEIEVWNLNDEASNAVLLED